MHHNLHTAYRHRVLIAISLDFMQKPMHKHQITNKYQIQISNDPNRFGMFVLRDLIRVLDFEFRSHAAHALALRVVIYLVFDICDLEFPACPG